MIKVVCVICKEALNLPGALLFSSPGKDGRVKKDHLCVWCEEYINSVISKKQRGD